MASDALTEETTPGLPPGRPHGPLLPPWHAVVAVAAGGMIGAPLRVWFSHLFAHVDGELPWATFLENVAGSFLLGLILILILERWRPRPHVQPFLATGILGSFTTFSNYTMEITALAGHELALAVLYAVFSIVAGLFAAMLGMSMARRWPRGGAK